MKILVISDIHGNSANVEKAIAQNRGAEYLLFLGDGENDFNYISEKHPEMAFLGVRGNNDFTSFLNPHRLPAERTVQLGGVTFYMTHGHLTGLSDSLLAEAARRNGASVVLFGHIHVPYHEKVRMDDGAVIDVFNPGSVGLPRGGSDYSCGVIEIKNGVAKFSHKNI